MASTSYEVVELMGWSYNWSVVNIQMKHYNSSTKVNINIPT
jgi:hypothetical protein